MLKMGKTSLSGTLHVPGSFTSTVSTQYQTKKIEEQMTQFKVETVDIL